MMGGFISEDPITFGGGQLSFYAYVGGNPLRYTDPLGLQQYDPVEEPNTPENQQLLEDVANNPDNELGTDSRGLTWYAETQPDGSQVWVSTMNGVIQNGGLNQAPRNYNYQTGLSSPTRPRQ